MTHPITDQLRLALRSGDLTGEQVVDALLIELAPERKTIQVNGDDLARLAMELRSAASSIGRAASLVERIRAGQPRPTGKRRRSAAVLHEERVAAAKRSLTWWRIRTPSGPEIAATLDLHSDGIVSDIRKRLDADRLALASTKGETS